MELTWTWWLPNYSFKLIISERDAMVVWESCQYKWCLEGTTMFFEYGSTVIYFRREAIHLWRAKILAAASMLGLNEDADILKGNGIKVKSRQVKKSLMNERTDQMMIVDEYPLQITRVHHMTEGILLMLETNYKWGFFPMFLMIKLLHTTGISCLLWVSKRFRSLYVC